MRRAFLSPRFLYFPCSLPNTSFWPLLRGSTQAIFYSTFLYSHGQAHARVLHCLKAHVLRYFSDIFQPALPYILSIFISAHPPKIPSPVWNYHAFRVVKLSCEKTEAPLTSVLMKKETWEKTISYIHSSLTFCQKSNFQFSSKKQGTY